MITKSPTLQKQFVKGIYFTKSARIAFSYLLKLMEFKDNEKLLIPSYIGYTEREGSGVLDPIEENNVKFDFYPIEKNFNIDLKGLEKLILDKSVKAILVIHYFGILHCDILSIKKMCKENNVLLIEDCAHTLYTKHNNIYLGDFGDFSFYSLHKVLPVETDGILKINNKLYTQKDIKISEEHKASYSTLEAFLQYDELNAHKKVFDNYKYMCKGLEKIEGIEILCQDLSEETFPINLPVLVIKMAREKFYFKMIDNGITLISLYYRLIDNITNELYPDSHYISNRIINFPINQDITIDEMDKIIKNTKKIMATYNDT